MQKIQYRRELKYLIDNRDYGILSGRLSGVLSTDPNAGENSEYAIHSLYFDDFHNTAFFEKLSGIENRAKFRIRYYNDNTDFIRMEKKVRNGAESYKLSAKMSLELAKKAVAGDYSDFLDSDSPLLREFFIHNAQRLMRPSVITDYRREAYVFPASNVRITFDKDIRTALTATDLFDPLLPLVPVIGADQMVLEVKYDLNLPKVIRDLLKCVNLTQTSMSKFTLCKKYITLNDWEVDRWA